MSFMILFITDKIIRCQCFKKTLVVLGIRFYRSIAVTGSTERCKVIYPNPKAEMLVSELSI